jgi:histone acetyltransferase (RNA polymerase elongator complex component)
MRVVRINLEELYTLSKGVKESAVDLLARILQYYDLKADAIYGISPDIAETLVLRGGRMEKVDESIDAIIRREFKKCRAIVELFDGYERAYACVK